MPDLKCPECGHNIEKHEDFYGCLFMHEIPNANGETLPCPCNCDPTDIRKAHATKAPVEPERE